jgi:hypothetical protein
MIFHIKFKPSKKKRKAKKEKIIKNGLIIITNRINI